MTNSCSRLDVPAVGRLT